MTNEKLDKSYAFSISCNADMANELENEITQLLKNEGIIMPSSELCEFEGPPPGAFGFGEGALKFAERAWDDIAKVPRAVEAIGKAIETIANKEACVIRAETGPDDTIKISFIAIGDLDEAEVVAKFADLVKHNK